MVCQHLRPPGISHWHDPATRLPWSPHSTSASGSNVCDRKQPVKIILGDQVVVGIACLLTGPAGSGSGSGPVACRQSSPETAPTCTHTQSLRAVPGKQTTCGGYCGVTCIAGQAVRLPDVKSAVRHTVAGTRRSGTRGLLRDPAAEIKQSIRDGPGNRVVLGGPSHLPEVAR